MREQRHTWQSADSDRRWLAALVDAMEDVSSQRGLRCEAVLLDAVRDQLGRPASGYLDSTYSRWN